MDIAPTEFYRRAFKKGMQGWEVAALQIALNSHSSRDVAVDGVFGPLLEALVVQEQKNHHLIVDGVLGVATQRAILTVEAHAAEKAHSLPVGLLVGLTEGESGYVIPAASSKYPNGTRDVGPLQRNVPVTDQLAIKSAYDLDHTYNSTAQELSTKTLSFVGMPGAKTTRRAIELAVLNHNWPAAAQQLARDTAGSWTYSVTESGVKKRYRFDEPAPWIKAIGAKGIETGEQWCDFYVSSKLVYVVW
jgi:hypothetical protein